MDGWMGRERGFTFEPRHEKTCLFFIYENKDGNQLNGIAQLISAFDSSKNLKSEFSLAIPGFVSAHLLHLHMNRLSEILWFLVPKDLCSIICFCRP